MGYEIAVTNLQMALAYAAIANGGKRMEPRLIKAVVDRDNRVVMQFLPKVVCQVVRPEVAKQVTERCAGWFPKRAPPPRRRCRVSKWQARLARPRSTRPRVTSTSTAPPLSLFARREA